MNAMANWMLWSCLKLQTWLPLTKFLCKYIVILFTDTWKERIKQVSHLQVTGYMNCLNIYLFIYFWEAGLENARACYCNKMLLCMGLTYMHEIMEGDGKVWT